MSVYIHITERKDIPPSGRKSFRVPRDVERMDADKGDFRVRTDGSLGKPRKVLDENGNPIENPFPEVYRVYPWHHVILNCAFQTLWRELNPKLSSKRWSTLLGNKLAWTNNTGFPGKYNCITGEDKPKGEPKPSDFPRFDQARLCANAIVTGTEEGDVLWLDTMLTTQPAMRAEEVLRIRHYWYYGTSVNPQGETNYITRLGIDGGYHRVIIPILTSQRVYLPLNELIKL